MQNLLKKKNQPRPEIKKADVIAQKYVSPVHQPTPEVGETKKQPKVTVPSISLSIKQKYRAYVPLFILAMMFYLFTAGIFFFVQPIAIKNVLFPNSYLPLFLCTFLGDFFFFTYIFLHARRGLFASLMCNYWLFLKLQNVFSWIFFLPIFIPIVLIELVLTIGHQKR